MSTTTPYSSTRPWAAFVARAFIVGGISEAVDAARYTSHTKHPDECGDDDKYLADKYLDAPPKPITQREISQLALDICSALYPRDVRPRDDLFDLLVSEVFELRVRIAPEGNALDRAALLKALVFKVGRSGAVALLAVICGAPLAAPSSAHDFDPDNDLKSVLETVNESFARENERDEENRQAVMRTTIDRRTGLVQLDATAYVSRALMSFFSQELEAHPAERFVWLLSERSAGLDETSDQDLLRLLEQLASDTAYKATLEASFGVDWLTAAPPDFSVPIQTVGSASQAEFEDVIAQWMAIVS